MRSPLRRRGRVRRRRGREPRSENTIMYKMGVWCTLINSALNYSITFNI